jgi:precorrin-8X/cobalt-precorrin-8 methylmutase
MNRGNVILDPAQIEARSFAIIDAEVGEHAFDAGQWPLVRRAIHTTADFEFAQILRFSPQAVETGIEALNAGARILCDTNMIRAGVGKARLDACGCELVCHVADADVAEQARAAGMTRSVLAVRKAVASGCRIFVIGNAPTALFELLHLARHGQVEPALIIGVPVGFVGAAESKEELLASPWPYIACRGRKGGSTVAVALLNALLILARES